MSIAGIAAPLLAFVVLAETGETTAPTLPDEKEVSQARGMVREMQDSLTTVLGHLEEARDENDLVKLNCVNQKLTQLKALMNVSEKAVVKLQEARIKRDAESSTHELDKLHIAYAKSQELLAQSEGCIGALAVYTGDTKVEVKLDRNLLKEGETLDDLVAQYFPELDFETRPPAGSPFQ